MDQNLEGSSGEFDADGGLGLEAELVAGESGEEVGLADARIADQNHLEQVIILLLRSPSRHSRRLFSDRSLPCPQISILISKVRLF